MSRMPETIWVDEERGAWCSGQTDGIGRRYPTEYVETAFLGDDVMLAIEERAGFGYGEIGPPIKLLSENDGWPAGRGYAGFYARRP